MEEGADQCYDHVEKGAVERRSLTDMHAEMAAQQKKDCQRDQKPECRQDQIFLLFIKLYQIISGSV